MTSIAVGIDVSKDHLDIYIDRPESAKRLRVTNDPEGIRLLLKSLGKGSFVVALEASGRYESLVRHSLEKAGMVVKVQNPRMVRRLAQGLGIQAKTDSIDAQLLARTVDLCPPSEARSKEREEHGDLSRLIDTVKEERIAHQLRLKVPGLSKVVAASLQRLITSIDKEIKRLEKAFKQRVARSSLYESYLLCQSVAYVGPVLARALVCELPQDLSAWSVRQIASYAGVAPQDNASGKRMGPSHIGRHGNMRLKAALYMPAMGLVSRDTWGKVLYRRLRARGLAHQQAIIAVMRKLLLHTVAVLKRGTAWEPVPPLRGLTT